MVIVINSREEQELDGHSDQLKRETIIHIIAAQMRNKQSILLGHIRRLMGTQSN